MSRQDAVHYAASRLIERIQTYGRLVLQLPGEYVKKKKIVGECTPYKLIQRDIATTEPKQEILRASWTPSTSGRGRTLTLTVKDPRNARPRTFTTTVTSLVLLEPSADLVESSDDFGSDSESDC